MTLERVRYTANVRSTGSWKDIFMKHPLLRLVFITLLAAQTTPSTVLAQVQAAPPISGVIGKVQSFTGTSLDVQTPSGVVHVDVKQPLTTALGGIPKPGFREPRHPTDGLHRPAVRGQVANARFLFFGSEGSFSELPRTSINDEGLR